jgi:hypothetical protein
MLQTKMSGYIAMLSFYYHTYMCKHVISLKCSLLSNGESYTINKYIYIYKVANLIIKLTRNVHV